MELSFNGRVPIRLSNGETRAMLEDGDTVILRAWGEREGFAASVLANAEAPFCQHALSSQRPGWPASRDG
jgi:hypothetical protein